MKQFQAISKGYTLIVTSWENDGDHYNTKSLVFGKKEKEKAIAVAKMCKELFTSGHDSKNPGIGNLNSGKEVSAAIVKYMKEHPEIYSDLAKEKSVNLKDDSVLEDICRDYHYELLGADEHGFFRVCEEVTLYYSEENVKVPLIYKADRYS